MAEKRKIKMLRNCFAGGEPLTEGETVEIDARHAGELVEMGAALAVKHATRETASAEPESAERATVPAPRKTKRRK